MSRDQRSNKHLTLLPMYLLIAFLLVILGYLLFRVASFVERYTAQIGEESSDDGYAYGDERPQYRIDGRWYAVKKDLETVLLVGVDEYEIARMDDRGYRNTAQADALCLLILDRRQESYKVLQLNRDTMVNIRALDVEGVPYTDFVGQLALSHTYGSGRNDSVENCLWSVSDYLYGLQIDHYCSFDMQAVGKINDTIGGVTLTVSDDLTPVDATLRKGETLTLLGDHALTYIRARGGLADSTNLNRMARQRQYIAALLDGAKEAMSENEGLVNEIVLKIADDTVTDYSAGEMLSFGDVVRRYRFDGILTVEGDARQGEEFIEFRADEEKLKKLILDTFYEAVK